MALDGVFAIDPASTSRAAELASRLQVPVGGLGGGVRLIVGPDGLSLGFSDPKRGKPFGIDFNTPASRARFARPPAIFRRALGVKAARVLDGTAGFGQDALMALAFGHAVTAVERSPVVFALLDDAVSRARTAGLSAFERLTLVCADTIGYLRDTSARHDVVYLDPMFTKPKTSAKSPKEMQLLQELFGPGGATDDHALLAAARIHAARVVVKQPLKAPPLAADRTHAFEGQSIRYDVYVR